MILLFDLIDFILYFGYFMVTIGAVLAIGFPLYLASKDPKSLVDSGIGLGTIFVLFLFSWFLSGNEVLSSYVEFGVDASLSKFIGGMIILVYVLIIIAISGIVYSEVNKSLKNG
jgi:hypothetical protein|tara:strand:- start:491 stop:832 length:342 start_codon:yes stop_codon:yes gene_type:complete